MKRDPKVKLAIVIVEPSHGRDRDRMQIEVLADQLEQKESLTDARRALMARVLRRYLADDYPPPPRNRPKEERRAFWIAAHFWVLRNFDREKVDVAKRIVAQLWNARGHDLEAGTVRTIATRQSQRENSRKFIARQIRNHRTEFTRSEISAALKHACLDFASRTGTVSNRSGARTR